MAGIATPDGCLDEAYTEIFDGVARPYIECYYNRKRKVRLWPIGARVHLKPYITKAD
ncbi:hypothetical protein SAMN05421823_11534 [Catalinimonas alkaloidigena]|uniref:Uncharacterized protein n=1 Tax=Catalinimonas alkaloidigena TaxID=1075417 RepID=A0A1G9TYZ5_9BACT|nr:hypothetical protein SAMN05421823_11534 [Catalinimonas alkaloidigena]